jgi:serine/threonine protein kinase
MGNSSSQNLFAKCYEACCEEDVEDIPTNSSQTITATNKEVVVATQTQRTENAPYPRIMPSIHDKIAVTATAASQPTATVSVSDEFNVFYDIQELIGVGTTSRVYKVLSKHSKSARGKGTVEYLACKLIDKQQLTQGMMKADIDPFLNQLRKEVFILRSIHHTNIVKCFDFMETHNKIVIITELLPGRELFDYILSHGALEEDLAREILYQIFQAVAYLHDRGVIHRDIKAENIVFSIQNASHPRSNNNTAQSLGEITSGRVSYTSSSQIVVKLIDFGFSTIVKHTLTGSFLGTGGYLAPEIRRHRDYSTSVDDWALGVLMYCTLSARLPFAVTVDALPKTNEECKTSFALKFPKKFWSNISLESQDLLKSLLALDPVSRMTAKNALNHAWVSALHVIDMCIVTNRIVLMYE